MSLYLKKVEHFFNLFIRFKDYPQKKEFSNEKITAIAISIACCWFS
jgi:hypothetical protein